MASDVKAVSFISYVHVCSFNTRGLLQNADGPMNISHACNLFVAELATPFFATSVAVFGANVCGFKIRLPSMSIKYSRDKMEIVYFVVLALCLGII